MERIKELHVEIIFGLIFILIMVGCFYAVKAEKEYCENKGGHILHVYKGALCVKDGLIIE